MDDGEKNLRAQELVRQIQDKSVQLSDLEVILDDYQREKRDLLREIGKLKACLWELIGETLPPPAHGTPPSALDEVND